MSQVLTYVVCTVDGQLAEHTRIGSATQRILHEAVGEPGFDIAFSGNGFGVFVNDTGHLTGMPRNVIGSCLAASISHKAPFLLAGPVVITGWSEVDPLGDDTETRSLTDAELHILRSVHHDLRVLLGHEEGVLSEDAREGWQKVMRMMAEHVATAPTPAITVLTGEDALNYLYRGRQ